MVDTFGFFNPIEVSLAGGSDNDIRHESRAHCIANRLQRAGENQILFVPYNPKYHWVLAVIDLSLMTVYYLDPLGKDMVEDLKKIIIIGFQMFQAQAKTQPSRKNLKWSYVNAPIQPGNVECGYYVMRYMKEIIENHDVLCENVR
ncbi:hypothetical protein Q3G72_010975 [Acer saccharum]|nr:hypothetical protein Q3G72_010975 [Acer saccharum]